MNARRVPLFWVLACLLILAGCGSAAATRVPLPTARSLNGPHTIRTVFLILMENHNWSAIKGSGDAPYINHVLLKQGAHAEQYYNPPGIHPSLPNYLWLEAGTNFGITDDADPGAHLQTTHRHLVSLLARARISWRAYEQGINGRTCPLTTSGNYAAKHNPTVYFSDVTGGGNPNSAYCIAHERPYSQFTSDLRRGVTARYNFITPDVCHDMHDDCPPAYNAVRQGDTWLSHAVPSILSSRAYRSGGAIFITWDEGEGDDGPIGMIVLSRMARTGFASTIRYTHSSTLRTIEEIFGVKPYLGDAAHANDLRALFRRFP